MIIMTELFINFMITEMPTRVMVSVINGNNNYINVQNDNS